MLFFSHVKFSLSLFLCPVCIFFVVGVFVFCYSHLYLFFVLYYDWWVLVLLVYLSDFFGGC